MKRLLVLVVSICLLLGVNLSALAAVHSLDGDFYSWPNGEINLMFKQQSQMAIDTWYQVDDHQPRVKAEAWFDDSFFVAGVDYSINDQTFLGLMSIDGDVTYILGSYLFESGLFAGLEYISGEGDAYVLSPGYRFSFGDDNYIAFSVDYLDGDVMESGIIGYDVDAKYFFDNGKVYGQYYRSTDKMYDDDFFDLGVRYAFNDEFVAGFDFSYIGPADDSLYSIGFTWKTDPAIVDFQFGDFFYGKTTRLGAMFNIGDNFGLGAEIVDFEYGDEECIVKFKYTNDETTFFLSYLTDAEVVMLSYELNL